MNLTFEQFEKIMNYFVESENFADKFKTILTDYNKLDFINPYCFNDNEAQEIILDLLEIIFYDKEHWIRYYIYELDCGRKWEPGMITSENGVDICLGDVWHLWNLLITIMVDGEL